MKCYFYCEQNYFLDYFKDPVLYGAVIHMDDILFQYNKREGRYREFIGNPTGIISVASQRDHGLLQKVMSLIFTVI